VTDFFMGLDPEGFYRTLYDYDSNGNMTREYRTSRNIYYNFLNLPMRVSMLNAEMINYTYTASGAKIRQQLETGGWVTAQPMLL